MSNTLNIGIGGLNAASSELSVISNNIANSSTTGFKSNSVQFADVFSSTGSGGGVYVSDVSTDYAQGALEYTSNSLDLAINGGGFFVTKDGSGNSFYTRSGDFEMDRDGFITTAQGMKVQGYGVDANGNVATTSTTDIKVDRGDQPASATTKVTAGVNLDARATKPETAKFDHKNPDSYNFTSSTVIYDQQGSPKTVTAYYAKGEAANDWSVRYMEGDNALQVGGEDSVAVVFNTDGTLKTPSPASFNLTTTDTGGGATTFEMDVNKLTQFGTASNVTSMSQDGSTPGSYTGIQVSEDGSIYATYSNGETSLQGIVATASFPNDSGLVSAGNTSWKATLESGTPQVGTPGTGLLGSLQSQALELSNVNMTVELVNMVVAQSNYQANAKTISASNEMTQVLMNTI